MGCSETKSVDQTEWPASLCSGEDTNIQQRSNAAEKPMSANCSSCSVSIHREIARTGSTGLFHTDYLYIINLLSVHLPRPYIYSVKCQHGSSMSICLYGSSKTVPLRLSHKHVLIATSIIRVMEELFVLPRHTLDLLVLATSRSRTLKPAKGDMEGREGNDHKDATRKKNILELTVDIKTKTSSGQGPNTGSHGQDGNNSH